MVTEELIAPYLEPADIIRMIDDPMATVSAYMTLILTGVLSNKAPPVPDECFHEKVSR